MPHLDVPPRRTHAPLAAPLPSTGAGAASVSSPDELSMFEVFDEDGDISGLPDALFKPEGASYESMVSDNNATLHALEVLASLDDDDHHTLDAAAGRPADLSGSTSDEKPSSGGVKTKMTAEEKKRRNRDCMRRLRNRRNDLITTMRREIQALEARLNQQLEISATGGDNVAIQQSDRPENNPENPEPHHNALRKLHLDHARVKTAMRQLREENYWLQKQIEQRQESLDAVRQIAQARDEACPAIDLDALEEEDIGVWIRNTDHFFPPVEDARAFEIVMESYRIIQEGVRITEKMKSPPNAVLGWSDQRSVDQHWANFMMQKTFPHESPRLLALKTWQLMSQVAEINVLQPKAHEMKVLQRLNEYTLVIARHTYFEDSKFSYCMIYLLFLLETDNGFVVGSRSLDPDEHRMKAFMAERMVVAKPFHCFHFQPDAASGGCKLTFAGRVDNVIGGCAKNCAMDMLLAMMRWESHCVSPLWRLAT